MFRTLCHASFRSSKWRKATYFDCNNHKNQDSWRISPAYDITYSLNPLLNYTRTSRALSINGKRIDITLSDLLTIADSFTIKNAKKVVQEIQD